MKSKRDKMSIVIFALIIYFIFLVGFAIYSAFAAYHLFQYCYLGDLCKPTAISYIFITAFIVVITLIFILIKIMSG